jgi:Anti-sigma factor NepR
LSQLPADPPKNSATAFDSKDASGRVGGRGAISEDVEETPVELTAPAIEAIGDALQTYYRALIEEPLPAHFLTLLAELEAKEGGA